MQLGTRGTGNRRGGRRISTNVCGGSFAAART